MKVQIAFGAPGYIANPYWPEMFRLIEIQKKSGVNRARTDANRRKALEAHLHDLGMSLDDYKALEVKANRPFHTLNNGNGSAPIIIPADSVMACLANACYVAPSKMRIESIRSALRSSDFVTTKVAPDGVWERFAVVQSGSGGKLSNQRGFRSNPYIQHFTATGTIDHDKEMVDPKAILDLLKFAGRSVGIGASRKMGWGRFTVQEG